MTTPRIASPRVAVVMQRDDQLVEVITQTDNRDAVRWDMTRGRKQWPTGNQAPMLWITFLAWSALNRSGDFEGDFAAFNEVALSIVAVDADGNAITADADPEALGVGPTRSGLEPD